MLPTVHPISSARRVRKGAVTVTAATVAGVLSIAGFGPLVAQAKFFGHSSAVQAAPAVGTASASSAPVQNSALSGSTLPVTGRILQRFSPVYMGTHWSMTQAQAVTIAQEFDVVAAQSSVFPKYVSAMKAANPNVRIVAYLNGTFDMSSGGTSYPTAWYEKSSTGARIQSDFGNYLLDPGNTSWQQAVAAQCTSAITKSHYDGCFVDTLGTAPLDPGYVTGLPINPATGVEWTGTQWLAATSAVAGAAQKANPSAIVVANGLANGTKYFSTDGATSALLGPSGQAMAELFLRPPGNAATNFPTVAKWLANVNMLVNAEALGESVLTTTKIWVTATPGQVAQWHKFTLASFLLGAGGHSYFSFLGARPNSSLIQDYAWDHVNIGTPLGAFTQSGNLYERSFSNGIVAVNPNSTPATITFAGTYTNLDGTALTSETLAPNSGDVFLHAG
jgi:hypothetical protein